MRHVSWAGAPVNYKAIYQGFCSFNTFTPLTCHFWLIRLGTVGHLDRLKRFLSTFEVFIAKFWFIETNGWVWKKMRRIITNISWKMTSIRLMYLPTHKFGQLLNFSSVSHFPSTQTLKSQAISKELFSTCIYYLFSNFVIVWLRTVGILRRGSFITFTSFCLLKSFPFVNFFYYNVTTCKLDFYFKKRTLPSPLTWTCILNSHP